MAMSLVVDANGVPEVQDGKPVIQYDDGRKAPLDFVHLVNQVKRVSDERDTLRSQYEAASSKAQMFDGLTPEQVQAARNLDAKKLVDAGKVDEMLAERLASTLKERDAREAALKAERDQLAQALDNTLISERFKGSKALEDYWLTDDLARAAFAQHFKRDGNGLVAYRRLPSNGDAGERIYSRSKPTELADFDEALTELLESHPNRDKWKKSSQATGGAAPGNPNPNGNGGRTMPRAQFFSLSAAEQMKVATSGVRIVD